MWCEMENEPIEMLLHQTHHVYLHYMMAKVQPGAEKMHGGQAGILFLLKFKGGMSQKDLANMLRLSAPSVTTAIKKLEAGGYVIREQDKKDQRIMRLSITPAGNEFVEYVIEAAKVAQERAMRNISKEEELLLRRLLRQMRDNLTEGKD
ncbi:MAG: MarR family transcriptional regulator [Hespellia sp.]|jgi:DNA-binding MarR family transcriptional regulator|nr:MarR family transcriptional regulator [Hespellia sp.]